MIRLFFKLVKRLVRHLPTWFVESLTLTAVNAHADSLAPAEGLRFLLRLDNRLYDATSRLSLAYEADGHPKHRITGYYDFFTQRIRPGERILDIGCGKGALAFAIASRSGAWVDGIDISAENIAKATRRFSHPRLAFLAADATARIFDRAYDAVVLSNVLEHLTDRANFLRRVHETTGAGRFLLRVPLLERDWRVPLKRELGVEWRLDPTHEIEYTPDAFLAELAEAGLEIAEQLFRWGEIWVVAQARPETPPT